MSVLRRLTGALFPEPAVAVPYYVAPPALGGLRRRAMEEATLVPLYRRERR